MPAVQLSRPALRKLALILDMHDIDEQDKATYNKEAAWIKHMTNRLRKTAERA